YNTSSIALTMGSGDPLAQIQVLRQQRITVADMLRRYGLVDPALRHFIDTMLMAYGLPVSLE
ncbi:hypothetical protein, partial [Klebsiella aerogenes]|uniref:hypothetical protein n=1 Tax=Klebsiella aerogenes TaxID=548 RepID=UPI001953BC95